MQDALGRRGSPAIAYRPDWAIRNGNALFHLRFPDEGPSVGIVIPTRNQLCLIRACVELLARTTYKNFRVLIVDNESDDRATLAWLEELPRRRDLAIQVLRVDNAKHGHFNFSHLVNEGVSALETEYVVLAKQRH